MDKTFDHHVHIGQWKAKYFSAKKVFSWLKQSGVKGCNFMSTTSCAPLHPDNQAEIMSLYSAITIEIQNALNVANSLSIKANAFYWIVPLFHLNGISLEKVFSDMPEYRGLKIHPKSHNWNPEIIERADLLTEAFAFAKTNNLPIILHTGNSTDDSPCLYEKWFYDFPDVKVTLAHCKNLSEVMYLFKHYPQLNGDTAFIPPENFEALIMNGYEKRLVYGSDFPIKDFNFLSSPDTYLPYIK